jgi:hypothetical protein
MVGWALASVVRWPRIVQPALAALMAVATLAAIHLGRAPSVSPAPAALQLADFIRQQTAPADRIAVEVSAEPFGGVHGDCSMKPLADLVGREVIGNPDPDFADPVRFDLHGLLGIPFGEVGRVEAALKRWGVSWVFCRSEDAARCLESIAGGEGVRVGQYRAFRLPWTADRFLVGAGQVLARVNRIELTDLRPANGWVVVKYRYHPGWRVSGGLAVQRYPVAEDRTGFIALHDPPAKVTLTFDSWDALRKNWPEQADSPQIPQISQIESKSPQRNSLTLSQCRMTNSE